MRKIARVLLLALVILLGALVLFFVLENQQAVTLVLFGWSMPSTPVAVPVLAALVFGLAVGPLLAVFSSGFSRRRVSKGRL
ncbi:TPA: lipopolysaccharide assembly protein LapA domain-containing protein [Pseudomonas putida]